MLIKGKRKALQVTSEHKATAKRQQSKQQSEHKRQAKMSNPKSFMEPTWEQDKDAGYDWTPESFAEDNAYNLKYGGNACIVCMGGSYVSTININKPTDKPGDKQASYYPKKKTYYTKYGGGEDDGW